MIRRRTVFTDAFIAAATSFTVIRGSENSSRLVMVLLFVIGLIDGMGEPGKPVARGLPRQQAHQGTQFGPPEPRGIRVRLLVF